MANITYKDDGGVHVDFEKIQKITIDHIPDIINHRILREGNLTVHQLEFINDGKCNLSYTSAGKIISFEIKNMATQIDLENNILVLKPQIL